MKPKVIFVEDITHEWLEKRFGVEIIVFRSHLFIFAMYYKRYTILSVLNEKNTTIKSSYIMIYLKKI